MSKCACSPFCPSVRPNSWASSMKLCDSASSRCGLWPLRFDPPVRLVVGLFADSHHGMGRKNGKQQPLPARDLFTLIPVRARYSISAASLCETPFQSDSCQCVILFLTRIQQ
jgi:hypothetical protein